jgi:hypothetical protein
VRFVVKPPPRPPPRSLFFLRSRTCQVQYLPLRSPSLFSLLLVSANEHRRPTQTSRSVGRALLLRERATCFAAAQGAPELPRQLDLATTIPRLLPPGADATKHCTSLSRLAGLGAGSCSKLGSPCSISCRPACTFRPQVGQLVCCPSSRPRPDKQRPEPSCVEVTVLERLSIGCGPASPARLGRPGRRLIGPARFPAPSQTLSSAA